MGGIQVGTSGYSFPDWVGPFYPPGTRPADQLGYYAGQFGVLELNTSYYRIPAPQSTARMAGRTPPEFGFIVKLHKDMTHEQSREPALYSEFAASLEPLREAGKMRGLLAQFPWAFRPTRPAVDHLRFLRKAFPDDSLHVEFRRSEWDRPDCFDFLKRHGIGYCCVDEPPLPGLMPARSWLTSETGYVRLHGRNASSWWGGTGSERYNYNYSEKELTEWLSNLREMADKARQTYVFFNNCHAGHAASNARLMKELLAREGLPF